MPLEPALFLPGVDDGAGNLVPEYSARHFRMLTEELFSEGVVRADGTSLRALERAAGANYSVDVHPGSGIITGDDQAYQGDYFVRSTSVQNLGVEPAPGSGLHRIDLVVAEVRDAAIDSTYGNAWRLRVIAGQAVADTNTPPVPALPPTAIPLAEIGPITSTTASITDAIITDRRVDGRSRLWAPYHTDPADPPSSYPRGLTYGYTQSGADGNWPLYGVVETIRLYTSRTVQILANNTAGGGQLLWRTEQPSDAWSPWRAAGTAPVESFVDTTESTVQTTLGNLATVGPSQSIGTGPQGVLRISLAAQVSVPEGVYGMMGYEITGGASRIAGARQELQLRGGLAGASQVARMSREVVETGLPAFTTVTVTAKYRASGGTATFGGRTLLVETW